MSWFTRLVLKSNQEQEQQIKPTPEFPVKELRATIQRFVDGNGKEDDLDYIVACQKDGSLQALTWACYIELRPSEVGQMPNVIDPNENIEKLRDALFPLWMPPSQLKWWRECKAKGGENSLSTHFQQLKKEELEKVLQEAEEWAKQWTEEMEEETEEDVAEDVQKEGDGEGGEGGESTIN